MQDRLSTPPNPPTRANRLNVKKIVSYILLLENRLEHCANLLQPAAGIIHTTMAREEVQDIILDLDRFSSEGSEQL